jgi:two-component system, chemotaxis family, response regulator Rcp1
MSPEERRRAVEILLVEDNPGDVRLAREIFREGGTNCHLHACEDGVEALAFLRREGRHAEAVTPDIIILDLNLPRKDGKELLAVIKTDGRLKRIPVVVLTTSEADQDIEAAYDLHANCYLTKPVDLERYIETIRAIENFWLTMVKLPGGE